MNEKSPFLGIVGTKKKQYFCSVFRKEGIYMHKKHIVKLKIQSV